MIWAKPVILDTIILANTQLAVVTNYLALCSPGSADVPSSNMTTKYQPLNWLICNLSGWILHFHPFFVGKPFWMTDRAPHEILVGGFNIFYFALCLGRLVG